MFGHFFKLLLLDCKLDFPLNSDMLSKSDLVDAGRVWGQSLQILLMCLCDLGSYIGRSHIKHRIHVTPRYLYFNS